MGSLSGYPSVTEQGDCLILCGHGSCLLEWSIDNTGAVLPGEGALIEMCVVFNGHERILRATRAQSATMIESFRSHRSDWACRNRCHAHSAEKKMTSL